MTVSYPKNFNPSAPKAGMRYLVAAICVALMTIMLWPIAMSFFASIKTAADASSPDPTYLPHSLSFENYRSVIDYQAGLWTYVCNSLFVAFLTIFLCLFLAIPAGYALALFHIPMKELWFLLLLASMMIPYQALLVPYYLMFSKIGLTNSFVGLALIHTVLQLPFSVYLMRNSFEAVPREMEEAAIVDGSSSFFILRRVYLPLVVPGIVTITLFAFITSWNEFLSALIFMSDESKFTVPIMLTGVSTGNFGAINWGGLQAGIIISIIPCALVYFLLQRYYMSGMLSGAVK